MNYISDTKNTEVKVDQLYKDKATLISVMAKYKIKHGFNFRVKRSDNRSYKLLCSSNDCCWRLSASVRKKSDLFKVRYFNSEHTCPIRDRLLTKVQATIGFISVVSAPKLHNHKRIHTPNDVIEDVRALYVIDISHHKAWCAKERALEMIRGKSANGYRQLPKYLYMLETVYPNFYIRMHKSEENKFMYLFISLRPLTRGFDYCRPVVVVDGAHLGGAYKGIFVLASTLDGAAYGVVDSENDCSWTWFFQQFKSAFGEREQIFKRSKNVLSDVFYSMAKTYRKEDFEKLMAKVVKIDNRVKMYLEDTGYEKWSRVHATVNRGRMMTSNIAECINECLVEVRQLPIIQFLEKVRVLFGSWNSKNREIASYTKETLGKRFEELLIINASKCSKMQVVQSTEFIYSVFECGRKFIVCLERKICNCGRFQIDEIPCAHAFVVFKKKNIIDIHSYCSDYYKPAALENTYEVPMVPMPDKEDWSAPEFVLEEIVLPPRYKSLAGRPRKKRKKNPGEKISKNTNHCGRCGQEGHNIRTCTFFLKED
ncbi:uncharacterized protein [Solanum tuberosum]|uniref:uncharacterized protein n=1 Tax=Solanum tuberosum TaxID=4113 RepID=UPI00073A2C64|nr:PREDICTED: uncharacterized protein LOC107060275 [Solanum tuberosum]